MALYLDTAIPTSQVSVHAAHRASIGIESFDQVPLLPLSTGLAAAAACVVLLADLWLLGYHRVVAACRRLASTAGARGRNRRSQG